MSTPTAGREAVLFILVTILIDTIGFGIIIRSGRT